jgi:anti-sigma regulatory factor (Ser/Thr protein kinase)
MTGATIDTPGMFVHGMGLYGSDEEFVRTFLPFCEAGLAADEPTLVRVDEHRADLLRAALDDPDGVTFLAHGDQYQNPPVALLGALELVHARTEGGARRLRLLGELPSPVGLSRDAWVRYEVAATHVLRDHPVFAVCAFDRRTTPEAVQAEMLRTHHLIVGADGAQEPNAGFLSPEVFMATRRVAVRDALEEGSPQLELTDPSPAAARHAIGRLARAMRLSAQAREGLLVGASELVTNALVHGGRPVRVRGWGRPGRVVLAVRDEGPGPDDLCAGLLPVGSTDREGGRGLWITHQLSSEVALDRTDDGFTVRFAVGDQ